MLWHNEKLDKIQYKDDFYLAANKEWFQAKLKENPNRIYYNSYSGVYDTIDNNFIDILENQKPQDKYEEYYLKTDTHPLPRARTNCCVVNFPEFYEAFGIKKGDKMYLAPQKRVKLW